MKVFLALTVLLVPSLALGATPSEEADRLFREAIALRDQDELAAACEKFAASQKLESSSGTLLNLGQCHEKFVRFASARSTYMQAKEEAAKRNKTDHVKKADERLRAIEGKVASIVFDKASIAAIDGARIQFDGVEVTASEVPVDSGAHIVEVTAPDHEKGVLRVQVDGSQHVTVVVPKPTPIVRAAVEEKKKVSAPKSSGGSLVPAVLVGGAGVVGIGLGVVSGLLTSSALSDAKVACPTYPDCKSFPAAQDPNDSALRWSTVSTVSFIAGGVLLAGGVVLYVVSRPSTSVAVSGSPTGANLALKLHF
jgi:hypothetical protein